jgi:hypothetical protein
VYYKQKSFFEKNGKYASSLQALGIVDKPIIDKQTNQLKLEATSHQFMATIQGSDNTQWSVNQDGLVQKLPSRKK